MSEIRTRPLMTMTIAVAKPVVVGVRRPVAASVATPAASRSAAYAATAARDGVRPYNAIRPPRANASRCDVGST